MRKLLSLLLATSLIFSLLLVAAALDIFLRQANPIRDSRQDLVFPLQAATTAEWVEEDNLIKAERYR